MDGPRLTDWLSAIGTVVVALVAAPAAVCAAIHTRRAADAAARAATEAANQVRELRVLREPKAVLKLRVPNRLDIERYLQYGRGNDQYRSGPPVYLDVWNVSGPTIMVMEVTVSVNDSPDKKGLRISPLAPQLLVESGKVLSIDVAHQLMFRVSPASEEFIDFPDLTTAKARFTVKYFSLDGERSVETLAKFQFRVTDEHIVPWLEA
jgi:hypothetical protein